MGKAETNIPIYSIDRFNPRPDSPQAYQVQYFNRNRNFQVSYPHRHDDFYEILHIAQGSGSYTIDGQTYAMAPGMIFFVSPGQIHELSLSPDVQGHIFLFTSFFYHFNKSDPFKLFELPFFYNIQGKASPLQLANQAQSLLFSEYFQKAIEEASNPGPDTDDLLRALLDLILIEAKRLYVKDRADLMPQKNLLLVKRFKQLIEQHAAENWSISQYAKQLGISANHLSETVKANTGRTSSQLIDDRMLLEIKRLLKHSKLSVSEIAYQLHFNDQSYFTKYFKKLEGVTPKEWRAQQGA